jgi:hypothetical protein
LNADDVMVNGSAARAPVDQTARAKPAVSANLPIERCIATERAQQPHLVTLQAVDARRATLGAADVDGGGVEVDLLPTQARQLADPRGVTEGHEDQQPIAARVAAVAGGGEQRVDLALRQKLALPIIRVPS